MADLTPSRIEPLGGSTDHHPENPSQKPNVRPKVSEKTPAPPPPIDLDKSEEHQLDEQA